MEPLRRLFLAFGLPLILTLVFAPTHTLTQENPTPLFETADCPPNLETPLQLECGYVTVPEDHFNPGEATVRLFVAIYRSRSENRVDDPLVFLSGGPGAPAAIYAPFYIQDGGMARFLQQRDVIFFDQRGTGYSEPLLACAAFTEDWAWDEVFTPDEAVRYYLDNVAACRTELLDAGVNLNAYSSRQSAADLDMIRQALGYEQVNLYGLSYGGRLALTLMRDYPQIIRSVILDSPYLPNMDGQAAWLPNQQRALDVLFDTCAADAECSAEYPDLETVFYELVAQLNEAPLELTIQNPADGADERVVMLTGNRLMVLVSDLLYSTELIPQLPGMLSQMSTGNYQRLERFLEYTSFPFGTFSNGVSLSVFCGEEMPFSSVEAVEAASVDVREELRMAFLTSLRGEFEACTMWGVPPAAALEDEPVSSDLPTLIFTGEFDPSVPPAWGELAAETLPNSFVFEFAGMGHGILTEDACPLNISLAFVESPTASPDASCIAERRALRFR